MTRYNHSIRVATIFLAIATFTLMGNLAVGGITIYLVCLCLASGVMALDLLYRQGKRVQRKYVLFESRYTKLCFLMWIYMLFVYTINLTIAIDRLLLIGVCMLFSIAIINYVREPETIRKLLYFAAALVVVSGIVVIGQAMNISAAYDIAKVLGAGTDSLEWLSHSTRYFGLSKSTLHFGYHSSFAIIILLFIKPKSNNIAIGFARIISIVVLIVALLFNKTRSAELVVAVAIIIWVYKLLRERKTNIGVKVLIFLAVIIGIIVIIMLFDTVFLRDALRLDEGSNVGTTSRIPMMLTAFHHAVYHPFGLGNYKVDPNLVVGITNVGEIKYVVNNTAHSLVGNCVASYGWLGLIAMLYTYWLAYKSYRVLRETESHDICTALIIGLLGLAFNSLLHNSYMYNGEIFTWLSFGCIFSLLRFEKSRS